jgi:hypothetical protein
VGTPRPVHRVKGDIGDERSIVRGKSAAAIGGKKAKLEKRVRSAGWDQCSEVDQHETARDGSTTVLRMEDKGEKNRPGGADPKITRPPERWRTSTSPD